MNAFKSTSRRLGLDHTGEPWAAVACIAMTLAITVAMWLSATHSMASENAPASATVATAKASR